eukprot:gene28383-biopygen104211
MRHRATCATCHSDTGKRLTWTCGQCDTFVHTATERHTPRTTATRGDVDNATRLSTPTHLSMPQVLWLTNANATRCPQQARATSGLHVADYGNNRVVRWSVGADAGVVVAGGNGFGRGLHQLWDPSDVAFDDEKRMYTRLPRAAANTAGRARRRAPPVAAGTRLHSALRHEPHK